MFPTFTGSSRSKRQVNLSGRNSNPFATFGSSKPSTTNQPSHYAVAHAQQERVLREQERRRPPAALKIQKTWRGYKSRAESKMTWKSRWDLRERWATPQLQEGRYMNDDECLEQLKLLALFASDQSFEDFQRLHHFSRRYLATMITEDAFIPTGSWTNLPLRLAKLLLDYLGSDFCSRVPQDHVSDLMSLLTALVGNTRHRLSRYSTVYYESIGKAARYCSNAHAVRKTVIALLNEPNPNVLDAYKGFAFSYLPQTSLAGFTNELEKLATYVNKDYLAKAMNVALSGMSNQELLHLNTDDGMLWLLARLIYIYRQPKSSDSETHVPAAQYVKVVSRLTSALTDDIGKRIDAVDFQPISKLAIAEEDAISSQAKALPAFVRSQILSLVDQENVGGLLAKLEANEPLSSTTHAARSEASALASYVLTLLQVFPRRRSDIQLWLYRGSTNKQSGNRRKMPATKYFYQAASSTQIFRDIKRDPRQTVLCLKPVEASAAKSGGNSSSEEEKDQQWRIILLFLELYTFILQVMDDEEFLSGSSEVLPDASWTRQSALPLKQIEELTVFLKNFAFALYWYAPDIAGEPAKEANQSLATFFGNSHTLQHGDTSHKVMEEVGGVSGMNIASVKGLVVGVLRMIYQRDSRRKIFPKDHWLMTKYFEMDQFMSAVVDEEEHGRQIDESYDSLEDEPIDTSDLDSDDDRAARVLPLVGTQHAHNLRRMQRLQSQQRKASRRKYLESVTPRLRILENMPFFIPFHTRVQIFRQFVTLDQTHRRGTDDPDLWRHLVMQSPLGNISKHRATVRREHIFDDAYKQFYDLGEGLKEPIQIRFVDKFDTIEEGIDGGGVTKEFLTSITSEAFGASNGLESLFVENDQHLLYPNPAAVEERKETLRQALFIEGSSGWNETIRDLLRRYEFLGRIIGKCLYEGILVDIHFAPFFLLKWALTGGSGSASKETGYRANLNDLRDLDEGLYQGLLQLKNYPGNAEADFSLDFTVTDTLRLSPTQTKAVTHELRPNGEQIPVTNENRLVYIASIARHRLQTQPYHQTSAFLRGLGTIISASWLSMFNQSELQTLIGGSGSEVSIEDLRANTQYGGAYVMGDDGVEHPSISMFWRVMESLDSEDVAKVLKFVTSTPRAPLLGFGNLNPRFSIRDSGADQTRLPSTSTCVNLLKLPIYRSERVLREKLLYSVTSGAGFNLS